MNSSSYISLTIIDPILKENIKKYFKKEIKKIPIHLYDGVDEINGLDLSNMQIDELPPGLFGSIKSLSNINFSNNKINKLPGDLFKNATKLTDIYFNNNQIKSLPNNLFQKAIELENIHFEDNQINELPDNLFQNVKKFQDIYFSKNDIETIPNTLFPNANFSSSQSFGPHNNEIIKGIHLDYNKLNKLPKDLEEAEILQDIHFEYNKIEEIPEYLFKKAKKLDHIYFNRNSLKTLPINIFPNVAEFNHIHFEFNKLDNIQKELFQKNVNKLTAIYLNNNAIKSIDANSFPENTSCVIEKIHFENNELVKIPNDLFKNVSKIKNIHFEKNKIKELPSDLFENAKQLKNIYFTNNHLRTIPKNLFKQATELENIHFEYNRINIIKNDVFENCLKLIEIYFNNNNIKLIEENIFSKARDLNGIHFNDNKIYKIPEKLFQEITTLEYIYFEKNQINKLPGDLFKNATKLTDIYFNNNQIKSLPNNLFQLAIELENIHFEYNQINELPDNLFQRATKLTDIYFNNNRIKSIPENIYPNAVNLKSIHFEYNQLEVLPNQLFQKATKFTNMFFNNNKLKYMTETLFSNAEYLNGIDFSSNKLKDIPNNIFRNVKKIDNLLDFSYNDINQIDFKQLKKLKVNETTLFDLRFNVDSNDVSWLFYNFFNANTSLGIKRIDSEEDLFNRLFVFYFNTLNFYIASKKDENTFETFEEGLNKLSDNSISLLDFFISFSDSFWILLLENFLKIKNRKVNNIDFKFYSIESLEAIFKLNNLNLIEAFFKKEISINMISSPNEYINEPDRFYTNIDFLKCFQIAYENDSEKMAIYLFNILKYVYKLYKDNTEIKLENNIQILKIQNAFSSKYYTEKVKKEYRADSNYSFCVTILDFCPIVKQIFEKKWNNLIESILNNSEDDNYIKLSNDLGHIENKNKQLPKKNQVKQLDDESDHILMLINQSKNEQFLTHPTTNKLLSLKWKSFPCFVYYFHFFFYLIFVVSYSFNIEYYNQTDRHNEKTVYATNLISFIVISYFTAFELLQLVDSFVTKEVLFYIASFKNWFELITFIPCWIILLLNIIGVQNNELKSFYYSTTILLSYWVLIMRLDKFHFIGKFVNVFGSIIRKSIPLFIIVFVNLIGFVLSFRNRTNYDFSNYNNNENTTRNNSNQIENYQMNHFNGSFSNSIFKTLEFLVGGLNIENMGIAELGSVSFINFIVYGCFIFLMTILFVNIFTGISIDEVKSLIDHAEAQIESRKINYAFKLESLHKRWNVIRFMLKLPSELYKLILKIKFYILKIKKIDQILLRNYFFECYQKYNDKKIRNEANQKANKNNANNDELDSRIKIQINELKMIIQSKFESIDRNMKKADGNVQTVMNEVMKNMGEKIFKHIVKILKEKKQADGKRNFRVHLKKSITKKRLINKFNKKNRLERSK